MKLSHLKDNWEALGSKDPLWAVLTDNDKKNNGWDVEEFFQSGINDISRVISIQNKICKDINYENALDFGCGVGRLTQALCEYYNNVTGVDISSPMIDNANRYNKYGDRCTYQVNSRSDLSLYKDDTFDAIYTFIVLQHMEPRYSTQYIKEFLRVLKPNGILTFQIPSVCIKGWVLKKMWKVIEPVGIKITRKPVIEMYCINKDHVYELIKNSGGTVRYVEQDDKAGSKYISYTYIVQKN